MTRRPFDCELRRTLAMRTAWHWFLIGALMATYGWMFGHFAGR